MSLVGDPGFAGRESRVWGFYGGCGRQRRAPPASFDAGASPTRASAAAGDGFLVLLIVAAAHGRVCRVSRPWWQGCEGRQGEDGSAMGRGRFGLHIPASAPRAGTALGLGRGCFTGTVALVPSGPPSPAAAVSPLARAGGPGPARIRWGRAGACTRTGGGET